MWRMPSLLKLGEGLGTSSTPQVVRGGQPNMSNDSPTRETMSLEDATGSNMWEIAAIVEVLERTGGVLDYG